MATQRSSTLRRLTWSSGEAATVGFLVSAANRLAAGLGASRPFEFDHPSGLPCVSMLLKRADGIPAFCLRQCFATAALPERGGLGVDRGPAADHLSALLRDDQGLGESLPI